MGIATVTMVLDESRQQRNLSSVSYHAVQHNVKISHELQEAAVQERKATTNVGANFHPSLQECWDQLMGLAMPPDDEVT